ncbi:MAG: hypothetical protein D6E12_12150 [Desulfovibrio sp.]|nr:MAG: hypothetical protein D6E12_12150 [Desulfovibrio sp.]
MTAHAEKLDALRANINEFMQRLCCDYEIIGDVYKYYKGSTVVFLRPLMWLEEHTLVQFTAVILTDVARDGNEAMFEYFSMLNNEMHLGRLSWQEHGSSGKGDILLTHSLLGDFLDPEELQTSVLVMAYTADDLDEELQAKFGGKRWVDGMATSVCKEKAG